MRPLARLADPRPRIVWDLHPEPCGFRADDVVTALYPGAPRPEQHGDLASFVRALGARGYLRESWRGVLIAPRAGKRGNLALAALLLADGWVLTSGCHDRKRGLWSCALRCGSQVLRLRDSLALLPDDGEGADPSVGADGHVHAPSDVDRVAGLADDLATLEGLLPYVRETLAGALVSALRLHHVPADGWGWTTKQNAIGRRAYHGAHIDVYRRDLADGAEWDRVGAYGAEMQRSLPTRYLGTVRVRDALGLDPQSRIALVDATVYVPESELRPTLPYLGHGRWRTVQCYPTGRFRGWWPAEEVTYAQSLGATVERIHEAHGWACEPWCATVVREATELRDGLLPGGRWRSLVKRAINAIPGAAGATGPYDQVTSDAERVRAARARGETVGAPLMLGVHPVWKLASPAEPSFSHAALASVILGRARVALDIAARACDAAYVVTDAVIGRGDATWEGQGEAPGQWKHKQSFTRGEFLAPNVYALRDADGAIQDMRAGGLALAVRGGPSLRPGELWGKILARTPITNVDGCPYTVNRERKPKRRALPDGTSVPWDARDLGG